MIRLFVCLLFGFNLLIVNGLSGQGVPSFSDSLRISLITSSPGTDLYAQFGHSMVRVVDYKLRRDVSFNYGTFNFNTPNFYWKFLQGKLNYELAVHSTAATIQHYTAEQRQLTEQLFLLSAEEKQAVASFLFNNALPENKEYLYDFFYDNCATRIRDVLEEEVNDFSYLEAEVEDYSFRQMLGLYVGDNPWTDFGFDLILGYPTDQIADMRDQMFLPDYLARNLTQFARNNGRPLLSEAKAINKVEVVKDNSSFLTPMLLTILLLIGTVLLSWKGTSKAKKLFDAIFFSILGILGSFMLFMWFGTDHWTTTKNLNVIWANPLFLLFLFLKKRKWLAILAIAMGIGLLLISWWLPQQFHLAFIPIWVSMIVRGADYLRLN